jgi:hypothetical protein
MDLRYFVTHRVVDRPNQAYADGKGIVVISDTYGTTFADIPKIIAIRRGVKPENIVVTSATLVEDE